MSHTDPASSPPPNIPYVASVSFEQNHAIAHVYILSKIGDMQLHKLGVGVSAMSTKQHDGSINYRVVNGAASVRCRDATLMYKLGGLHEGILLDALAVASRLPVKVGHYILQCMSAWPHTCQCHDCFADDGKLSNHMRALCAVLPTHHNVPCIKGDHLLEPDSNHIGLLAGHVKPGPQIKVSRRPAPIYIVRPNLKSQFSQKYICIIIII